MITKRKITEGPRVIYKGNNAMIIIKTKNLQSQIFHQLQVEALKLPFCSPGHPKGFIGR